MSTHRSDFRTPVTLLTGFLGSGKTSLLNRALRSPDLANAAVVINEFGAVPLDHVLSQASDDQIVVLENGCLCCTVFGDLIATLNRLYHLREAGKVLAFNRVIIETSGLAQPAPVMQAFLSDPTLQGLFRLDSVVATLDCVTGPGTLDRHAESVRQLVFADRVILTKLDLLGEAQAAARLTELTARVRALNPGTQVMRADEPGAQPVQWLIGGGALPKRDPEDVRAWLNVEAYNARLVHVRAHDQPIDAHSHESRIATFCLVRDEPITLLGLELLLEAVMQNLGPALLRLKGLVNVSDRDGQPAVIHGAQHLLHNIAWLERWPDEDRSTRIVFITDGIDALELRDSVEMLDRLARRSVAARARAAAQIREP